jgi:hypothetical protein
MVHLRVPLELGLHHLIVINLQAEDRVPFVEKKEAIKMDLAQEDLVTLLLIDPNPVHRGMDM